VVPSEGDDSQLTVEVTSQPNPVDVAVLSEGLERFNRTVPAEALREKTPLAVFIRDNGRVVGGAYGDTHYEWAYLSSLWVDAPFRRSGWGRRLVERFEAVAVARHCRGAWVDTYMFQAPGFYERLGYREFGRLRDFPPGSARLFYWKPLRTL
jgi:ribosomal protein S18 acetylase RimI-like enzyme